MYQKKGPWTVKSTQSIYKNHWLEVLEEQVIKPDGQDGTYTTIDIIAGVTVLALDAEQNVYLSKNYQYALDDFLILATAGGGIDKEGDSKKAAQRELKEEAGLSAEKWTYLGVVQDISSNIISAPNHMFLAEDLNAGKQELEGTETISIFKVPLEEAVEKVMSGEITHAVSALIILKVNELLKTK